MPTTYDPAQFTGWGRQRMPNGDYVLSYGPGWAMVFTPECLHNWYVAQGVGGATLVAFQAQIRADILLGVTGPHVIAGDPPFLLSYFDPSEEEIRRRPSPVNVGYYYTMIRQPRTEE